MVVSVGYKFREQHRAKGEPTLALGGSTPGNELCAKIPLIALMLDWLFDRGFGGKPRILSNIHTYTIRTSYFI